MRSTIYVTHNQESYSADVEFSTKGDNENIVDEFIIRQAYDGNDEPINDDNVAGLRDAVGQRLLEEWQMGLYSPIYDTEERI